jgi:hypothetical protein
MTDAWGPTSIPDIVASLTRRYAHQAVTCERIARQVSEPTATAQRAARNAWLEAYRQAIKYLSGERVPSASFEADGPTLEAATLAAICIRLDFCGDCLSQHDPGTPCDPATTVH